MTKLFKKLKKGLEEIIAHQEGKITLSCESVNIPKVPSKDKTKEINKLFCARTLRPRLRQRLRRARKLGL